MKWVFGLDSGGIYFQNGTYKAYFRDKWPNLSDNQIVAEILEMYNDTPAKPITVVWDDRIAGSMKTKLGDAGLPIEGYSRTGDVLDTQSGSALIRGDIE